MARKLTKLRIREISSVDRGANSGSRIMLMKPAEDGRARDMLAAERRGNGMSIIAVAKALLAGDRIVHHTRADFYKAMEEGGERIRKSDGTETREQAFARFATEDDDGRLLMRAMKAAPPGAPAHLETTPPMMEIAPVDVSEAYAEMMRRARKLMRKNPGLTEAQAFQRVYEDPKNVNLTDADRAHHFGRVMKAMGGGNGVPAGPSMTPSLAMLHSIRDRIRERNPKLSEGAALEEAMKTKEGRAHYQRYRSELLVGAHR